MEGGPKVSTDPALGGRPGAWPHRPQGPLQSRPVGRASRRSPLSLTRLLAAHPVREGPQCCRLPSVHPEPLPLDEVSSVKAEQPR